MNAASEQDNQHLEEAVLKLSAHFDSVHIFVSRHDGQKGTVMLNKGAGHVLAQLGQIQEYVVREDEAARIRVRKAMMEQE